MDLTNTNTSDNKAKKRWEFYGVIWWTKIKVLVHVIPVHVMPVHVMPVHVIICWLISWYILIQFVVYYLMSCYTLTHVVIYTNYVFPFLYLKCIIFIDRTMQRNQSLFSSKIAGSRFAATSFWYQKVCFIIFILSILEKSNLK